MMSAKDNLISCAVQTGVDDGKYVEIISGLREGETVITSAAEGLEDGMKVTVTLTGGDN